jgi:hypothetical protein
MRDVIWTIIIIWVVYKLVDLFRGTSVKKTFVYNKYEYHNASQNKSSKPEGSVTVESKTSTQNKQAKANTSDGEYVDFEEIK